MNRGDVVLVYIPYIDGPGGKVRPVVVIQCDASNFRLPHTIVAAISTSLRGVGSSTHYFIDPGDSEGKATGILHKSVIRCDRLFTVEQSLIGRRIGHLAPGTMEGVEECLRSSLGLPSQDVPILGNYEKWIGHRQLIGSLSMFLSVLSLERVVEMSLPIDLVMSHPQWNTVNRILATNFDVISPLSKEEFDKSGHRVRFCFSPKDGVNAAILSKLAPEELSVYPIHRATLWAYSGPKNTLNSVFDCWNANEGSTMLSLQNLGAERYEIGFDASGNVVNSLLLGEHVRFVQSEKAT
jgi:mRNA interferase MazF